MRRVGLFETQACGKLKILTATNDNRRFLAGAFKLEKGLCSATESCSSARKPSLYDEDGRYERMIHAGVKSTVTTVRFYAGMRYGMTINGGRDN